LNKHAQDADNETEKDCTAGRAARPLKGPQLSPHGQSQTAGPTAPATAVSSTRSPITQQLEQAVGQIPGWSPLDELLALFNLAFATAGLKGDLVEVGSWCGRTAMALGLAAKLTGNTRLHCFDLFPEKTDWQKTPDGTYSIMVSTGEEVVHAYKEHTLWREPYERDVVPFYDKHRSNLEVLLEAVQRNGLTDIVSVHRGTTAILRNHVPTDFRCRLAFIDGDHSHDAVCADIRNIEPFLVAGGWLCFDDAFSCYQGVDRAIQELILDSRKYDLCQQLTRKLFVARRAITA